MAGFNLLGSLSYTPVDGAGQPYAGALLYVYRAGTTTATASYTTSALSVANPHPVVADGNGRFANVWVDDSVAYDYRVRITTSTGSLLGDFDNIPRSAITAAAVGRELYAQTAAEQSAGITPTDYTHPPGNPWRYGADGLEGAADTAALASATTVTGQAGITAWRNGRGAPAWPRTAAEVTASVIPPVYAYEPGDALRYGMNGDGTTDNVTAYNRAVSACLAGGYDLYLAKGTYRFASRPNVISNTLTMRAEAKGWVTLLRDYTEATATNGFIESNSGALTVENIYIVAAAGTTGGAGLRLTAQSSGASPDYSRITGCVVTGQSGTGTWVRAFDADGTARTSGALGLRDLVIDGCDFFASTTDIARFASCNNLKVRASFFPAGGTSNDVRITGVSGNTSNNVLLESNLIEDLQLDWANDMLIQVSANIQNVNNTSNVNYVTVVAPRIAAFQTNWTNSRLLCLNQIQQSASLVLTDSTPTVATGQVGFGVSTQTTIGANGGASALTALPVGYLRVNIGGTNYIVPYYNS